MKTWIFCWNITPFLAQNALNPISTHCRPHITQVTDLNLDLQLPLQCLGQVLFSVTSVKTPKQFLWSSLDLYSSNTIHSRSKWERNNSKYYDFFFYSPVHFKALHSDNHIWLLFSYPALFREMCIGIFTVILARFSRQNSPSGRVPSVKHRVREPCKAVKQELFIQRNIKSRTPVQIKQKHKYL